MVDNAKFTSNDGRTHDLRIANDADSWWLENHGQ